MKMQVIKGQSVSNYAQMDQMLLREERAYILKLSTLRDGLRNVSLHCLNEMKVMVVKDTEREHVEFICRKTGTKLVDHFDRFTADMLGFTNGGSQFKWLWKTIQDWKRRLHKARQNSCNCCSGSNKLVIEEAECSIHDDNKITSLYAMEVIPFTLAKNVNLNPVSIVKNYNTDMPKEKKQQVLMSQRFEFPTFHWIDFPASVSVSQCFTQATETLKSVLKIDDM
ncbi:LOW QUALITY PROTEIN: hypothetical protein U0070_004144, partial [Myodes glareolus]